ncbi:MAG: hypothetical protein HGA23_12210, partial [Bacteroidales bacterium]|nr:hypothetical protein [Bacteroidales bacterium]
DLHPGLGDDARAVEFDLALQALDHRPHVGDHVEDFVLSAVVFGLCGTNIRVGLRDLALLLDKNVKFSDIQTLANRNGKGILRSVNLFDVYEGDKIEAGKKSYAVSFTMQDDQKTLTDNDIEKLMKRLAEVFEKELGAVIRR